ARFASGSRGFPEMVPGATLRITRHRNVNLVLGDGTRVAVTHTPFSIGRGPGNDLVLPSLAVSRYHAELIGHGESFALRDRGSRNGITVDGERQDFHVLRPGEPVILGDVEIQLEDRR